MFLLMTKSQLIFFKRTLYALIIIALVIPTFALTFFGQLPGRIAGMTIFILVASWGIYEICTFMTKNYVLIVIFALTLNTSTFLLPYESFLAVVRAGVVIDSTLKGLIYFNFNWETFVVPIFAVILFMIADKNLRHDYTTFLRNFSILMMTSFLTSFLAKGAWIINIFDWTKLMFVISIAIVSDTCAYVGGALFGKKLFRGAKLAPNISPSKTWAGFIIAFIITFAFASSTSYFIGFWNGSNHFLILSIVGSLILAIFAQLGDLLFSWFKRNLHTKDFSSLIPIHGGIFDRLDGISAVIFMTVILFIVG